MSSSDNKRKRPHSANNDKYLTKTVEYLYSPYKKKNDYCKNYDQKCMAIQSSIDRIFSSLNKSKPVKNIDLKTFKNIIRSSSPFQENNGNEEKEKVRSQIITPKHSQKDSCFASTAAKSFSGTMNMKITSSSLKASKKVEEENYSALKNCQLKIDYYQKIFEDQTKEKELLQQLVDSIKNEINKSEKDHTKMNKSSHKFYFEKEKTKKILFKQESSSQNLNKEIGNVTNEILNLQEEISEIQNMKNKLKFKATSEEDKIKKMMEFGQTLKKEISTTNKNKEKTKTTLMANNRKLNGFKEKINILEKEKKIFVSKLQTTIAMT